MAAVTEHTGGRPQGKHLPEDIEPAPQIPPLARGGIVRPAPSSFDNTPRIIITRHHRWRWSIRIVSGLIVYRREDGGPYALTRARAERKGRRLLRAYLRPSGEQEFEVDA